MEKLLKADPEIYKAIKAEEEREQNQIILIASENTTSSAILEAQGSLLTNKYAEGYSGKRYYGGCEHVDQVETIAIQRTRDVFGAEHVNVQPHSGSTANMAVYFAMLSPGDKVLGMDLSHGGHLTHGAKVSFSGTLYNSVTYGLDKESGLLDYDAIHNIAMKERPKLIIVGASAYSRIIDFARFREIADEVGAYLLSDIAHIAGLVAAGLHPNPVEHAHFVTTTTHKTLKGPRGGLVMCKAEYAKAIDRVIFPGIQGGPLMHVIAAKAVAMKEAKTDRFKQYQQKIVENARALASRLTKQGICIISGGTDTHLMLIDLRNQNVTGRDAASALETIGICVNKNSIPHDDKPATVTSGIRIGTPTVSARGMGVTQMEEIADIIVTVISRLKSNQPFIELKKKVGALCEKFPMKI